MPRAPAHLLAGGLLSEEVEEITSAFGERLGLLVHEERHSAGWAAVWLTRAVTGADQPPSGISVAARTIAR